MAATSGFTDVDDFLAGFARIKAAFLELARQRKTGAVRR